MRTKYTRRNGRKPALERAVPNFPLDLVSSGKRGFTIPLDRWLRNELRPECEALFQEGGLIDLLEPQVAMQYWTTFVRGSGGSGWLRAWNLYALARWREMQSDDLPAAD